MAQQNITVFMYQFNFAMKNWIDWQVAGNYHSSELAFVFDNEWPPIVHEFNDAERRMSDSFTLYWSNMAKHHTPNHNLTTDQAHWPAYSPSSGRSWVSMDVPTTVGTELEKAKCDFWDAHYTKYYFEGL